jgi:hypothetical protein
MALLSTQESLLRWVVMPPDAHPPLGPMALCITAVDVQVWFGCCRGADESGCPLFPRKRTLLSEIGMSAKCQWRT